MKQQPIFSLTFKQGISRRKGFEGTPTLTLTDHRSGKKYKATGAGLHLPPIVLAEWATDCYQEEWLQRKDLFRTEYHLDTNTYRSCLTGDLADGIRNLVAHLATADTEPVRVAVDNDNFGKVARLLEQIGVHLQATYGYEGATSWISGYVVQEKGEC